MDKVKVAFPGQRTELWRRSRIHLERPTEPVRLMLTAGRRGERKMHCLAWPLPSPPLSMPHLSSTSTGPARPPRTANRSSWTSMDSYGEPSRGPARGCHSLF
ncbi:hypothetical protein J4Q44_G00201410 [Coregonus suidteri]|uniref:Uncharacterized protein n=1 Tax=Coregonus suidteri TaxID=861788 RepID=A0AAN8LE87_9TELE